ncbi:MAG: cupin domain-containing protein [Burkholderiales bacterium]|nr:cupin domain-containing protein [Burkholderiales bacterium]
MKHARAADLLARLPGPVSAKWPAGERFSTAIAHGSMSVELYAPVGIDPQTPHTQDELYFIHGGAATFTLEGDVTRCAAGDVLFVPAGAEHRFSDFTHDFATWVVFWGPQGGEH